MALGIPTSSGTASGDIKPRIEYDARAGRFFRVDRHQDAAGNWTGTKEEIPLPFKAAMDFAGIRVGWIKFVNGVDMQLVQIGEPLPPKPGDLDEKGKPLYKGGFQLDLYNTPLGFRTWNSTAKCVVDNVDGLHTTYTEQQAANPGKVPIVEVQRVVPIQSGQSTNYAPVMTIVAWAARPEALNKEQAATQPATNGNGHATQPQPQQSAAEPVPPPVQPQPAPQPAQANAVGEPVF